MSTATTPFWQIRNRDFLTRKPSTEGNFTSSFGDLNRDLNGIRFNGLRLLDILLQDLNIEAEGLDNEAKIVLVKQHAKIEHIEAVFKKQLLSFCVDETLKTKYAGKLSQVLYQWGLIWAATQALTDNIRVANAGYIVSGTGLQTHVNIYEKEGGIYIEEHAELFALSKIQGGGMIPVGNEDGSSMMTIKNRFHLRFLESGAVEYAHTDLTVQYHNSLVKSLYDERSLFTRIKDFLKSVFGKNGIKEFTLDTIDENTESSALKM